MALSGLLRSSRLGRMVLLGAICALATPACGDSGAAPVEDGANNDTNANTAPVNQPPVARVDAPERMVRGSTARLNGSLSSDPEGAPLTYQWEQVSGPEVALDDANASTATFAVPDTPGALRFRLLVSDGVRWSTPAYAEVLIQNRAPVAALEAPALVAKNSDVILDALGSSDPDGDPITYRWAQLSGDDVRIRETDVEGQVRFKAPRASGVVELALTVSDGVASSEQVAVRVEINNTAPTADAGDPRVVDKYAWVVMDSEASGDPDGDPITYAWTQVSGPPVAFNAPNVGNVGFYAPGQSGTVVLALVVSDGEQESAPSSVQLTVRNREPVADAGADQVAHYATPVTLDGLASSDPDGDPLRYRWEQRGGPDVALDDAFSPTPVFTSPDVASRLVFWLYVTDGESESLPSEVVVDVGYAYEGETPRFEGHPFRQRAALSGAALGLAATDARLWVAQSWSGLAAIEPGDGLGAPAMTLDVDRPSQALAVAAAEGGHVALARGFEGVDVWVDDVELGWVLASTLDTPGRARALVWWDTRWLLVADHDAGVHAVDVSDPGAPRLAATLPVDGTARGLHRAGDASLYVVDAPSRLVRFDFDPDAEAFEVIEAWPSSGELLAAYAQSDRVWMAQAGEVVGLSRAGDVLGAWETPASALDVLPLGGDRLAVALGAHGVALLDTSGDAPLLAELHATDGAAQQLARWGDLLAVADAAGGVALIDPDTSPGPAPLPALRTDTPVQAHGSLGGLHVLALGTGGVALWSEGAAAPRATFQPGNLNALGLAVDPARPWAWIAAGEGGLVGVSLAQPDAPIERARLDLGAAVWALAFGDDDALWAATDAGVTRIDLSDPEMPQVRATRPTARPVRAIVARGDDAIAALNNDGLHAFAFSAPDATIAARGVLRMAGQDVKLAWSDDGARLVAASASSGVVSVDTANLDALRRLGAWAPPAQGQAAQAALLSPTLALVADSWGGATLLDLADPAQPVVRGAVATYGDPRGVVMRDGVAWVALAQGGLQRVTVNTDARLVHTAEFAAPLEALTLTVEGLSPGERVACAVTGGGCVVEDADAADPTTQRLTWTLPAAPGDFALNVAVGNGQRFVTLDPVQVFVR